MKPTVTPIDDGIEVIDRIERHRYRLRTHRAVTPEPVDPDELSYPVGTAVRIRTDSITLPTNDIFHIRDEEGTMIGDTGGTEQTYLEKGKYTLELSTPFKMYFELESSVHIYFDTERTYITLGDVTTVLVGIRSYHTQPAGTITTTTEPEDVMAAVSMFGSALKTTTSERSYPTLRGHPPRLELGDRLEIPDGFEPPETGVRLEVPPELGPLFVCTPLAFYLGARLVPGSRPRLVTDAGFTYPLAIDGDLEGTVERVLRQVFFLDCLVRTEGAAPADLYERNQLEPSLSFDLRQVYGQPVADQLEAYLEVPFSVVEPYLQAWRLETRVAPTAPTIEFLPYFADDLALVQIADDDDSDGGPETDARAQKEAIHAFTRSTDDGSITVTDDGNVQSTIRRGVNPNSGNGRANRPATVTQLWRNDDGPDIRSTTPLSAFHHRLGRDPRDDPIEIQVVCNDPEMQTELKAVGGIYGDRSELPFDVTVQYELTRAELRETLTKESDFFHYIGHIDHEGFQCTDGKMAGETLEEVGPKAFLLNACQSHDQGLHLIEAGSVGGIVTLGDVINSGAINVGSTIARLLNRGYPLHAALKIARKRSLVGQQYLIVGDGSTTIAQPEIGCVTTCTINREEDDFLLEIETYEASIGGKGSLFTPYIERVGSYFLIPGTVGPLHVTTTELQEYLDLEEIPVFINDMLYWSTDLNITKKSF